MESQSLEQPGVKSSQAMVSGRQDGSTTPDPGMPQHCSMTQLLNRMQAVGEARWSTVVKQAGGNTARRISPAGQLEEVVYLKIGSARVSTTRVLRFATAEDYAAQRRREGLTGRLLRWAQSLVSRR